MEHWSYSREIVGSASILVLLCISLGDALCLCHCSVRTGKAAVGNERGMVYCL